MTMTLHRIDPLTVGREAVALVLGRLGRLAVPLAPAEVHVAPPQGETDLSLTVAQLCAWARSGDLADWTDHEDAADALQTAAEALCAAPLRDWRDEDLDDAVDLGRDEEPGAVALVLACALTRLRVCRAEPVSLAELARLAGISYQRIHQLADAGELVAARGRGTAPSTVTAAEARRWLASRGLLGW